MLLDKLNEEIDLNDRATPSARLFTGIQIGTAVAAWLILIVDSIFFFANRSFWLESLFGATFYPLIILFIASLFCGFGQLFRGVRRHNLVFLLFIAAAIGLTIGNIVYQVAVYGFFHLPPFTYLITAI